MSRWTAQATWVGPTPNVSGPMDEQRGMVLHVMQGSLAGSIAWGKNPASGVSFHFGTRKSDGLVQQLVDTDITAWTQGAGNGSWVSVENEDFSGNPLSAAQVEACAQLYARGVREYGWLYQVADSPSGFGLGWHGMGGTAWGNHPTCPGQPIKDQRGAILARARQINSGQGGEDMAKVFRIIDGPDKGLIGVTNGAAWSHLGTLEAAQAALRIWRQADYEPVSGADLAGCGVQQFAGPVTCNCEGGGGVAEHTHMPGGVVDA